MILPGLTRSDLGQHLLKNTGRMQIRFDQGMPPEEVAAGIVRALVRGRHETVLGREAKWLLRLNRWVPRILDRLIARKVRQLYAEEKSEIRSTKSETNSKSESDPMTETTRPPF